MLNRRRFVQIGAAVLAGLFLPRLPRELQATRAATGPVSRGAQQLRPDEVEFSFSLSQNLAKFVQPLRGLGGSGIPVAQPDATGPGWWQPGVQHYTIDIGQYEDRLHPDLPNPTRLWGYGQGYDAANPNWTRHLGGVIMARRGTPVQITFRNHLPAEHILPIDTTIMGADGARNRTSVHLHGGFVPWLSDGNPYAWWDPSGNRGSSFINVLNPGAAPNEAEYYYPNQQSARLMWYHDHALGTTRTNAYAGLATAYVVTDSYEDALVAAPEAGKPFGNLPGPLDPRTLYLVFQDKVFVRSDVTAFDYTWPAVMPNSRPGDLWYAHVYDPLRWALGPDGAPTNPSAVPEFFGDTVLANGTAFPYVELEQREYRVRILNACNARFLRPVLYYAQADTFPGNAEADIYRLGPGFVQIGSEGGFLPAPAPVSGVSQPALLLAPAERADLLLDLRNVPAGSTLILYNDAPAPFPTGDPGYDHHAGNPDTPNSIAGYGPDTRTLLQIRVQAAVGQPDPPVILPAQFTPTDPFLIDQTPGVPTDVPAGVGVRYLTLNEDVDGYGRLIQFLGTSEPMNPGAAMPAFGRAYMDPPTETPWARETEVWEIINLTGDTHPIHFHLVNVQVLSRQLFDAAGYTGGAPTYLAQAVAPEPNELGWKETVRVNPGEVTRVLMKFDLPAVPFPVPPSPRTGGHEYVWHCHILEHEEHDMMRPLVVADTHRVFLPLESIYPKP